MRNSQVKVREWAFRRWGQQVQRPWGRNKCTRFQQTEQQQAATERMSVWPENRGWGMELLESLAMVRAWRVSWNHCKPILLSTYRVLVCVLVTVTTSRASPSFFPSRLSPAQCHLDSAWQRNFGAMSYPGRPFTWSRRVFWWPPHMLQTCGLTITPLPIPGGQREGDMLSYS